MKVVDDIKNTTEEEQKKTIETTTPIDSVEEKKESPTNTDSKKDITDEDFVKDIIIFYEAFLNNVADSINSLAKIQEEHKEGYEKLKEVQINPNKLFAMFKKMSPAKRGIMLDFFMQASLFEKRLVTLFKLTPEQQRTLATDLKKFIEESKPAVE